MHRSPLEALLDLAVVVTLPLPHEEEAVAVVTFRDCIWGVAEVAVGK